MAYRLSCSGCGGAVTADDAAIRRALAVCSRCNTILRVHREGLQPDREAVLHQRMPDGVAVERHAPRSLSIRARRPRGAWALNKLTSSVAWGTGLGVGLVLSLSLGLFFGLLGIVAGLAAFVAAAKLQREHQPLRLSGGYLRPAEEFQPALAVNDVQQIYAAVCHVGLGGDTSYSTANVFALTHKGERVLLVGPLQNEQVALYIEQVLEAELQLFDLPVFGEASRPEERDGAFDKSALPEPQTIELPCEGCGAALSPGEAEARRGVIQCSHCDGLSLLYEPFAELSVLGASGSEARRFEIDEEVDGLSVEPLEANRQRASIELLGDRVVMRRTGSAPLTVSSRDLERVYVKPSNRSEQELDVPAGLKAMEQSPAYSGDVDLEQLILGTAGAISFRVMARHAVQGEIELTGGVQDPREAFLIARTLTRVLAKSR